MFQRFFEKNSDLAIVLLVVGILTILFVPIPAALLDLLILANVSFAMLLLLLTFYVGRPVEFSTFPSLLLIATLFRLSLNVATTRLILSDANAGKVISAIGAYVVGGNYVIGLIVFLILVVVQYVVVTNGAQRVSEVAARFTLDSMPGQQMSIDADLNMGFITQEEAKRRRKLLEKESGFYGAMDGASKFVKGDAIAGILIMLINIIGGLVIGVMQMGMSWPEALHNFTLLTVGDGIVTQVPALVIAVGTGIIVTRSASDANLGSEVLRQITLFPKAIFIVVSALAVLLVLPGMPVLPVTVLVTLLFSVATFAKRATTLPHSRSQGDRSIADKKIAAPKSRADDNPYEAMHVEPVEVTLGSNLRAMVSDADSVLMERIRKVRLQFAWDNGMVLPAVRFRDGQLLGANAYEIFVYGVKRGRGDLMMEKILAIRAEPKNSFFKGIPTKDPSFGLPAVWIDQEDRDAARAGGYSVVDPMTVFITHFQEVVKRDAPQLLTRTETDKLLQGLRDHRQGLVEELIPAVLSISDVQKVLQELLKEQVSIRNLEAIIETLIDASRLSKETGYLVEAVRQKLGAAICQRIVGDQATMTVLTLHPKLEFKFMKSTRNEPDDILGLSPKLVEAMVRQLTQHIQEMSAQKHIPIILCAPPARRYLRRLIERPLPNLRVLSMSEVPTTITLRSFAIVSVDEENTSDTPEIASLVN